MKKILIIVILSITVIFFLLHYYWYSELERITYKSMKYEPFSNDLFLSQSFYADGMYFKLRLPYKKHIYASPYIYTISFNVKNDDIDYITFDDIIIFLDEKLDVISTAEKINIRNRRTYTQEEILYFKETNNIMIDNEGVRSYYYISFYGIKIPYEKYSYFDTVLSITIHYKSGEVFTKKVTTRFGQKIEKMRIFPTA